MFYNFKIKLFRYYVLVEVLGFNKRVVIWV